MKLCIYFFFCFKFRHLNWDFYSFDIHKTNKIVPFFCCCCIKSSFVSYHWFERFTLEIFYYSFACLLMPKMLFEFFFYPVLTLLLNTKYFNFSVVSLIIKKKKKHTTATVVIRTAENTRRFYATNCLYACLYCELLQRWNDLFKCGFVNC